MTKDKAYIILATYNPDLVFFKKQIQSISDQTHTNWRCIVTDDNSPTLVAASIKQIIQADPRFSFRQNQRNLGVFHNFEAGLGVIEEEADFILYSDQDDIWKKNKIERCLQEFKKDPSIIMVHSDMEMIDENDTKINDSCFAFENRDLSDFSVEQLVIKNSITGCTLCFRASLVHSIVPFPLLGRRPAYHHDLWTAMHASIAGKIVAIKEPLVEYRQHQQNVLGAVQHNWWNKFANHRAIDEWCFRKTIILDLKESIEKTQIPVSGIKVFKWIHKMPFSLSLFLHVFNMILHKQPDSAIGINLALGKPLEFIKKLKNLLVKIIKKPLIFYRILRELVRKDFQKQVKTALAPVIKNNPRIFVNSKLDENSFGVEELVESKFSVKITPDTDPAVNIVLPNLKPQYIFGGISTAIRMGTSLAKLGHQVRFISSDLPVSGKELSALKEMLQKRFQASPEDMKRIALVDGSSNGLSGFSSKDVFMATFWPTAFKIENTLNRNSFLNKRFFYLIQDYEPGFYSWSDEYALVESTYRMNCTGIYNTSILADYFRQHNNSTIQKDLVLQPEIEWSRYSPPTVEEIAQRRKKKIVIYGRPGTDRNLFRTLVTSLRFWIKKENISPLDVEIVSAGEAHLPIELGNRITLRSVGKLTMSEYAKMLRESDLGISLMLSPHPSYPPFDMAASGMVVITNRYENKCLDLSPNFISTYPNPYAIAEAISANWCKLDDADSRIKGSIFSTSELGFSMEHVTAKLVEVLRTEMHWEPSDKKNESAA